MYSSALLLLLHQVFGHQEITYANRGKLKYVEATTMEIQRLATIGEIVL